MPRPDRRADRDDDPIRRSRKPGVFWTPVTVSLVAGGGLLLVGLAVFLLLRGTPAAVQAGADNWDFHDLTAHLKAKGLDVSTRPSWTSKGWPAVTLISPNHRDRDGLWGVSIVRCPDLETARLEASKDEHGFAFGRFAFSSGPVEFLAEVRAALGR